MPAKKPAEAGLLELFPEFVLTQEFPLLLRERLRRDGGVSHLVIWLKEDRRPDAVLHERGVGLQDCLFVGQLQQDEIAVLGNLKLATSLRG